MCRMSVVTNDITMPWHSQLSHRNPVTYLSNEIWMSSLLLVEEEYQTILACYLVKTSFKLKHDALPLCGHLTVVPGPVWHRVIQCDPSLPRVMNVTLVTCDGAGACGDQWPVPRPRAPAPLTPSRPSVTIRVAGGGTRVTWVSHWHWCMRYHNKHIDLAITGEELGVTSI